MGCFGPTHCPTQRRNSVQVRTNAAIALGEFGPAATSALPELVNALQDDAAVACYAAVALGRIGESAKPAVVPLADTLRDGQKYVVLRYNAAIALGQLGEFGPPLEVLEREQTGWLCNAFAAIGPMAKDVVPSLAEMLNSFEPADRVAATHALGGIATNAKEAAALIEQLAND